MSFIWIVVLGVVTGIAFLIGQGTNTAAGIAAAVFFIGSIILYFAPTIVAHRSGHANRVAITVLNILLGWTFIGWVAALVWAYSASSAKAAAPEPAPVPQSVPVMSTSVADEIQKLAGLRDAGLINEQEFEDQKRKLLA